VSSTPSKCPVSLAFSHPNSLWFSVSFIRVTCLNYNLLHFAGTLCFKEGYCPKCSVPFWHPVNPASWWSYNSSPRRRHKNISV
jgi:hypothetical protein